MAQLKAVIFGAIGVIAETSDLQRQAFNTAFREAELDWVWDRPTYQTLLAINGGRARLRAFRDADPSRSDVSETLIAQLHHRKTHHYANLVADGTLMPRAGVGELIEACRKAGLRTALCTSTSADNVDALSSALARHIDFKVFASITAIDKIAHVKPAPDAYLHCLAALGLHADEVVAIEDTPVSMAAAIAAGIAVVATPGTMTSNQDFSAANRVITDLRDVTLADLQDILDVAVQA